MLGRHDIRPLLAAALAGVTAAVVLWACSGEVLPPGETSGLQSPGGSVPTGADGGAPGVDGGSHPDGGTGDGGSPGTDGGSASGDRFPASATLYQDVSGAPLDPSSPQIIAHLADAGWGTGAMQIDFSFDVLHADSSVQPRPFTPAAGYYSPDCDQVPVPVPAGGATEGSSTYACDTSRNDCHLLVYQGRRLYELYQTNIAGGLSTGSPFTTVCAVVWDLDRDYWQPATPYSRGDQCTSADAAGLPIAPLLVTGAELQAGLVPHALRFILPNPRMASGVYVHPATHAGAPAGDSLYPPYGARFRLRSTFDLSQLPNAAARAVAVALQTYGMILADGGNVPLTMDRSAAAYLGPRDLAALQVSDFEMVAAPSGRITLTYDCTRTPVTQ
ncbi:MAG TPA: hypothetical protein VFF12_05110 [Myxococcaceae bacterium]|nr:hypothetical protein [Myxococcaceae bacterium]